MSFIFGNNDKVIKFFFNANAVFSRHYYFTEELWRKVDDFKNADRADVMNAFLASWFKQETGIITYPFGASWCYMDNDENMYNNYIEKYQPVFEDYAKWCNEQR